MTPAPRPTALIIGAARSGTTALAQSLRAHPDVFVTQPKEPHFLALGRQRPDYRGPGDDRTINREVVTDAATYHGLFASTDAAVRVEASVSTLYAPDVAIPAIRRHAAPDVRLVAVLRDPVARAFSSYQYLRSRGHETAPSLAAAVELEDERVEAGYHHLWHYTRMSRYHEQLVPFVEAFGDRLLVLDHADLQTDPVHTLGRVAAHLGIAAAGMGLPTGPANASGQPRSRTVQQALTRVAQSRLRPVATRLVPFRARERIRSLNLRSAGHTPRDAAAVHRRVQDDLARLPALLPGLRASWMPTTVRP